MPDKLSQSAAIYERFTAPNAAEILKNLHTKPEKTFESDWLDFKSGRADDKSLKEIWSKAVSAFANSEGGVLVWGIKCEKDKENNIDAVSGLDLVKDINAFKSRLMELRHPANDPPVAGILIQEVPIETGSAEGFVVCFIPESNSKPHRAEYAGKRFFLRIGDTSNDCNVSLLRQLFYPKKTARLEVIVIIKPIPPTLDFVETVQGLPVRPRCIIDISVGNIGHYSIQDVRAKVICDTHWLAVCTPNVVSYNIAPFERLRELGLIHPVCVSGFEIVAASQDDQFPQEIKIYVFSRDNLPFIATVKCPRILNQEVRVPMVTPEHLGF